MTQKEQEYWDELVMVAKRKKELDTTMVITPDQILAVNDEIIRLNSDLQTICTAINLIEDWRDIPDELILQSFAIVKNELAGEIK
jgi:hypothetical protein